MKVITNYGRVCTGGLILLVSAGLLLNTNCSGNRITRSVYRAEEINKKHIQDEYIKLHIKNGETYLLTNWNVKNEMVTGYGSHLDLNREIIAEGNFEVPVDRIILAETNRINSTSGTGILTALTVISGIFTIYCIANPKACFGSCPTFYAGTGENYMIQAEGFSSSISPALEETDIDALYRFNPVSADLSLKLKNEAYETHVIRSANILAVPKKEGRVFALAEGGFVQTYTLHEPYQVTAPEGDCLDKFCSFDGDERFSTADSSNLAEKEIIEITFKDIPSGDAGIVIASRQTLLTTFLFYQSLAYMGTKTVEWLAGLEADPLEYKKLFENPLGPIELLIKNADDEWEKIGETGETGPIATDIKIVPLNNRNKMYYNKDSGYRIGLRMTKGLWRIDYAALALIGDRVDPVVVRPTASYPQKVNSSNVISLLNNQDSILITFPGDEYLLSYSLPVNYDEYELFLESRGYYLEWIRDVWLYEEDPAKIFQMLFDREQYYKDLAPEFKKIEHDMETTFWSSKYVYP